MGMLGTVINCLCMADALRKAGLDIPAGILTKEELADVLLGKQQEEEAEDGN